MIYKRLYFTDFLYGVVVGTSFQNLSPQGGLSLSNILLVASIFIIADDWVLYHHQLETLDDTAINLAKDLFMGIAILIVWYLFSASSQLKEKPLLHFFNYLAIFYWLTGIGEHPFPIKTRLFGDFLLASILTIVAVSFWVINSELPISLGIALAFVTIIVRVVLWNMIIFRENKFVKV